MPRSCGLRAVARSGVHDFMAQHGSKLRFTLQFGEQAAIHRDLAAGQGPGIRHGAVEHLEFIGQLAFGHGDAARRCRQLLAHLVHIGSEVRQHGIVTALALAHGRVVLLARLDFLAFGNELDLALAGNRIGAAAAEQPHGQRETGTGEYWI